MGDPTSLEFIGGAFSIYTNPLRVRLESVRQRASLRSSRIAEAA